MTTLVDHFGRAASPLSLVLIEHLGGAVAGSGETRPRSTIAISNTTWRSSGAGRSRPRPTPNIAWTRACRTHAAVCGRRLRQLLGAGEQADRVRAAYGDEKYARLVELKNRYDPTNRFRFNQNIAANGVLGPWEDS